MTDIDDRRNGFAKKENARAFLGDTSNWPPGALLENYVGVALLALPSGETTIVRVYPYGPVSGSMERGMLGDALSDSNHDRDRRRRSA